jgi:uncharacterized membrane protein YhaH (DUF805 family)
MFLIWLIGFVILGMVAAYKLGKLEPNVLEDIFWVVIIGVVFWPVVLAVAIVISPFALPFYLGAKKKEKLEKIKEEEKLSKMSNK